jgi:hypothetical protein
MDFSNDMSFCGICANTPFLDLPPLPLGVQFFTQGKRSQVGFNFWFNKDSNQSLDSLGIVHHKSFDDLFASASLCAMCQFIAQQLEARLSNADICGENLSQCQIRRCMYPDKRRGFINLSPVRVDSQPANAVIGGAGFCAEAGTELRKMTNVNI